MTPETGDRPMPLADAANGDAAAVIEMGRRVIATEAEALWGLAHLDQSFADAVALIRATRGRLIVCGLGKSGQIAAKVAATFTATGTPAHFLHAGDALHGDLGGMTAGDTLLLLSNSGDTREFGVIIRRADMLEVPMIAITSSRESVVAISARHTLLLPAKPEACPYGCSPTTSTTMMLALGDALAITVLQLNGLSARNLRDLHPGGRLGLDLLIVDSFMHRGQALPLISAAMPMDEVICMIGERGFGVAGVVDDHQRLLGVVTDGDIRRHAFGRPQASAEEIMTRMPRVLFSGAMASDALASMAQARITSIFVLHDAMDGRVAGLVHIHDLLRLGIG